jgi:ribosomal protein S18 acetylase RimI-like enzyme
VTTARIRHGRRDDVSAIVDLYKTVAETPGGIARLPDEVTREYVADFVAHSLDRGILIVAELPGLAGLAGELHAYRSDLHVFKHVLGELTVAVHPAAQGQGIGRAIFTRLLDEVTRDHADVTRVELVTQESNVRAMKLYESLGFRREGRLEARILSPTGGYEADIPLAWIRSK